MKDFRIGPLNELKEEFLQREGILSPFTLKLSWESVPQGFLPVVLIRNYRSNIAVIAHSPEQLEDLTSLYDERRRTIYLVRIVALLPIAGEEFIEYVSSQGLVDEETLKEARRQESENLKKLQNMLFSGEPRGGGLSNEEALSRVVPEEFKSDNPWSTYAMRIFFLGADISNWKWRAEDEVERRKQRACFTALLGTFSLPHEDKEAVAGWMLSAMLTEVPEYLPSKKK